MAAADLVRLEIVMPVHNRRALTLGCLRSIDACDHTGLDVHVVVVDDGSTDGTAEAIAAGHPGVEVIRGRRHAVVHRGHQRRRAPRLDAATPTSC